MRAGWGWWSQSRGASDRKHTSPPVRVRVIMVSIWDRGGEKERAFETTASAVRASSSEGWSLELSEVRVPQFRSRRTQRAEERKSGAAPPAPQHSDRPFVVRPMAVQVVVWCVFSSVYKSSAAVKLCSLNVPNRKHAAIQKIIFRDQHDDGYTSKHTPTEKDSDWVVGGLWV